MKARVFDVRKLFGNRHPFYWILATSTAITLAVLFSVTQTGWGAVERLKVPGATSGPCPGDVNLDEQRGLGDLVLIVSHLLGESPLNAQSALNGDVNQDGQINVGDLVALLQHSSGVSPLEECVSVPLSVTPRLRFAAPAEAPAGTAITLTGAGFRQAPEENQVLFYSPDSPIPAVITAASTTALSVVVPNQLAEDIYAITVTVNEDESNGIGFEVKEGTNELKIVPESANLLLTPGNGLETLAVTGGVPPYKLLPLEANEADLAEVQLDGSVIHVSGKSVGWIYVKIEDSADPPVTVSASIGLREPRFEPGFEVSPHTLLADSAPGLTCTFRSKSDDIRTQRLTLKIVPSALYAKELEVGDIIGLSRLTRYDTLVGHQYLEVTDTSDPTHVEFVMQTVVDNTLETFATGRIWPARGSLVLDLEPPPAAESLNRGDYALELTLSDQIFKLPTGPGELFDLRTTFTSVSAAYGKDAPLQKTVSRKFTTIALAPSTPRLERLLPAQGEIGRMVRVAGTGFSATPEENLVTFSGPGEERVEAEVLEATESELVVAVPRDAVTGTVRVAVNELESNDYSFHALFHPNAGIFFQELLSGVATGPGLVLEQPPQTDIDYNPTPFFEDVKIVSATYRLSGGTINSGVLEVGRSFGPATWYNLVNGDDLALSLFYQGREEEGLQRYLFDIKVRSSHNTIFAKIFLWADSEGGVQFELENTWGFNPGFAWWIQFEEPVYQPPAGSAEIDIATTVRSAPWSALPGNDLGVVFQGKAIPQ